ncbi:hypothetical protein BG011_000540 [Mortierella polycephala]|uniref:Xylulose kinase n=1 Tax=Mortierella polycephala TaxID=41804 RepID=A0A9P6Q7X6_9FUNG|nr:hypothetical protein BG011_000540 [Mortierella polycephala]
MDKDEQHHRNLFLGLDLSTQQLKVIALASVQDNDGHSFLEAHSTFAIQFDTDLPQYHTQGGVTTEKVVSADPGKGHDGVVTAPVLMWVDALHRVLDRMQESRFPFERVVAISGAAQQHGSVYWSSHAQKAFRALQSIHGEQTQSSLIQIFKDAFTIYQSPIWQDTSTTSQCQEIEEFLGGLNQDDSRNAAVDRSALRQRGSQRLAELTGSKAYERYTGSQILKIVRSRPEIYQDTERISLVSSFLASLLIAQYASIDAADGSGMNLLDIETKTWDPLLTQFISQGGHHGQGHMDRDQGHNTLVDKLGEVDATDVKIVSFTGDNPATVMALQAQSGDAIVSLGTSDTLLLYTHTHGSKSGQNSNGPGAQANARLSIGYLCHPVDTNGYLMLYCAKNGSLARERIRDLYADRSWDKFAEYLKRGIRSVRQPMDQHSAVCTRTGFYFFDREIWPPVKGVYRFQNGEFVEEFGPNDDDKDDGDIKSANVLAICESQLLAMRIRSSQGDGVSTATTDSVAPPGISRILATGGASSNQVILQLLSNVFGVPVVCMSSDVKQGAGSAAWGAARKAFLYGHRNAGDDTDMDVIHSRSVNMESRMVMPDLEETKRYIERIPDFIRLELSLPQAME